MSGKARRGRAYQCTKCDWRGESSWGLEHYCKKHCEGATESPYFCEDCKYAAATTGQIQRHQKGKKHKRKTASGGGHVRYNSDIETATWLMQLSQEESQAIWAARGTTPTPSQPSLNDTLESTEDYAVNTGTAEPECPPQKPEAKSGSNTQLNDKPREDQKTREATEVLEKINREMSDDTPQAPKENSKVSPANKTEGLQAPKENSRVPAANKTEGLQAPKENSGVPATDEAEGQQEKRYDHHGKKRSTKPVEKVTKDRESTVKRMSSCDKTSMPRLNHNPPKKSIKDKDSTFERMPSKDKTSTPKVNQNPPKPQKKKTSTHPGTDTHQKEGPEAPLPTPA